MRADITEYRMALIRSAVPMSQWDRSVGRECTGTS